MQRKTSIIFSLPLDMPDESVRQDFLDEIQLMKAVGSHKNIVSMVGCCTLEETMFLLVEYAPYGDLLHYLRKHRKMVFIPLNTYIHTYIPSLIRSFQKYRQTYLITLLKPNINDIRTKIFNI